MEENVKEFYTLDCGCQVPILDKTVKTIDGLPSLEIDYYNLRHDCPLAWEVFKSGKTKGVFQLETSLGKKWSKQSAPENLLEAAALISILRPGCSKYVIDNKSMTQHYCDRKSGKDETKPIHPALTDILSETYQVLTFQEQTIEIAKQLGGFNLQEADKLRKAMGSKDAKLMASIRDKFVDGCLKVGLVGKEDAAHIFDNIEKSNRYAFNKCLSKDTVVESQDGFKMITEVAIGDKVKTPDGFSEVVDIHHNGPQELYEVTLESGKSIRCTINHKFLCEDGNIRELYKILENDYKIVCDLE
jgi:hypothetical protein